MDAQQMYGLIIGGIAVVGGLAIGMVSIIVSVPWSYKEKLAKLDAANKERMALIEKGYDPAIIFKEKKKAGNDPLFWGLLLVGLGAGFILGYLLHRATGWNFGIMAHGTPLLLAGFAMIGYFVYRKRYDK